MKLLCFGNDDDDDDDGGFACLEDGIADAWRSSRSWKTINVQLL